MSLAIFRTYVFFLILFGELGQHRVLAGATDPYERDVRALGFDQVLQELVDGVVLVRQDQDRRSTCYNRYTIDFNQYSTNFAS